MNQKNNNQTGKEQNEQVPLSETIPNAHSAGDGSLGRGKDSLVSADDEPEEESPENTNNNKEADAY